MGGNNEKSDNNDENLFISSNDNSEEDNKGILEKARDKIHEKAGTEEQLYYEQPKSKQLLQKIPTDSHEAAVKIDSTIDEWKAKFKGTDNEEQKEESKDNGPLQGVRNKIYQATKPPDVKEREELRKKPFQEKLATFASGETEEGKLELFSSKTT